MKNTQSDRIESRLARVESLLSKLIPGGSVPEDSDRFTPRYEGTPTVVRVRNWDRGRCKWCTVQGAPDGALVVKIPNVGWYHLECFRALKPQAVELVKA